MMEDGGGWGAQQQDYGGQQDDGGGWQQDDGEQGQQDYGGSDQSFDDEDGSLSKKKLRRLGLGPLGDGGPEHSEERGIRLTPVDQGLPDQTVGYLKWLEKSLDEGGDLTVRYLKWLEKSLDEGGPEHSEEKGILISEDHGLPDQTVGYLLKRLEKGLLIQGDQELPDQGADKDQSVPEVGDILKRLGLEKGLLIPDIQGDQGESLDEKQWLSAIAGDSIVEVAKRRSGGDIGKAYDYPSKRGWRSTIFYSPNSNLKPKWKGVLEEGKWEKDDEELDRIGEGRVNWGGAPTCNIFVYDVLYDAGFKVPLNSVGHYYSVAATLQFEKHKKSGLANFFERIKPKDVQPGDIYAVPQVGKRQAHMEIVTSQIENKKFSSIGAHSYGTNPDPRPNHLTNDMIFLRPKIGRR